MADFHDLKTSVIDRDLCTRCGSCVGVCPKHALYFADPLDQCIPEISGEIATVCEGCSAPCIAGCSGSEVDFPALYRFVYDQLPPDYLMGHTIRHHIGYAANPVIRKRGSSGGIISAILDFLLSEKRIDGILTLIDVPDKPLQPEPRIIRNSEDLKLAAQSKYCLAPVNSILDQVGANEENLAYVGLPCQVHSIRKLQMINNSNVKKLSPIIGSYCGSINYFTSIVDFLKKHGIDDLSRVKRIQYRAGEWPGYLNITLISGEEFQLEKFYANYMTMFYTVKRCQVCFDLTNEFADISAADAWAPKYEERGKGYSLIVTRTPLGERIVNECIEKGVLISETEVSRKEIMTMHSHTIDNKKIGSFSRSKMWVTLGRSIPEYNLKISGLPLKRVFMGIIVGVAFEIGATGAARLFVRYLPLKLTGSAFKWFRNIWKSISKPEKTAPEYQFEPK